MWPFSTSKQITQAGVFDGYIERHCHILPGVDDGVQAPEESLRILRKMEELGVAEVWFTPHVMEEIPNTPAGLRERFQELEKLYRESEQTEGSIQLHLAAEYMLDSNFEKILLSGDILPHADGHLLVETSYINAPYNFHELLKLVKHQGFHPILAHPERYVYMEFEDYEDLKDMDVRFQLNLPALLGAYGHTAQRKSHDLLEEGFYDICGMDTHSERSFLYFTEQKISKKHLKMIEPLLHP